MFTDTYTVYNMESQKVEKCVIFLVFIELVIDFYSSQTPVMNDVRDVTITKNGLYALVSYEDAVSLSINVSIRRPLLRAIMRRLHLNYGASRWLKIEKIPP